MVSVSVTYTKISNVLVKALFRLSDALKCVNLSTTKVKEKSCVREQVFGRFVYIVNTQTKGLSFIYI